MLVALRLLSSSGLVVICSSVSFFLIPAEPGTSGKVVFVHLHIITLVIMVPCAAALIVLRALRLTVELCKDDTNTVVFFLGGWGFHWAYGYRTRTEP